MAEYLDIVDENGIPTGETVERETTHAKGLSAPPALDAKALASLLAGKPSTTAKNKKPKTFENKGISALFMARQKEFESPTFRLGVDPIR